LAFTAGSFTLLQIVRHVTSGASPLLALALAIALSITLDPPSARWWDCHGAAEDRPTRPELRGMTFEGIILSVVGILAISFSSGIVAARSFAMRNRHRVDANRALIGFSAANGPAGLFDGFPVTAT